MTAMKRRAAKAPAAARAGSGKTGAAAAARRDMAEANRRAKAARTPIAKTVTAQVAETKRRAYSGKAPRDIPARLNGTIPAAAGSARKRPRAARKGQPR